MPGARRDPTNPWFGPRLPISDPPKPSAQPCDRDAQHVGGIRFDLYRYSRKVGVIRLCDRCIRDLVLRPDPDPLHVEAA